MNRRHGRVRMFWIARAAAAVFVFGPVACSRDAPEPDPGPASGVRKSPAELTRACWIGNRRTPLSEAEAEPLRASGITRIYWHSADILLVANVWQFPQENPVFAPTTPDGIERVPVLRLGSSPDTAATRGSFPALGEFIAAYLRRDPSATLQIDYDCPDSLLPLYAELLGRIRAAAGSADLSVTALAGWANTPGFDLIQDQADEIVVKFYDLRRDAPADIAAGIAIPMVDLESLRAMLPHWRAHCRTPWLAGFPNFSRLSVFGDTGLLVGHADAWDRDSFAFHPDLEIGRPAPDAGITWLVPTGATVISDELTVDPAQRLLLRQPDGEALREGARLAAGSGAGGVVWFPLPEPGGGTGFTASHLEALLANNDAPAVPNLSVTRPAATGTLVLANNGPSDLPARVGGEAGRGWQIEIDGGTEAAFTEAAPGTFARMLGHRDPDAPEPDPVAVQSARVLTFRFAALPAGARLESGPLRLRPGVQLRWRLDRGDWRGITTAP